MPMDVLAVLQNPTLLADPDVESKPERHVSVVIDDELREPVRVPVRLGGETAPLSLMCIGNEQLYYLCWIVGQDLGCPLQAGYVRVYLPDSLRQDADQRLFIYLGYHGIGLPVLTR